MFQNKYLYVDKFAAIAAAVQVKLHLFSFAFSYLSL